VGRPRRTLNLVPSSRFALGIDIDPAAVTYVLLDLRGNVVARTSQETEALEEPKRAVADITRSLNELVTASGVDPNRVLGVGIASPGPVDLTAGALVAPPHLPGWDWVDLRDMVAGSTGLPAVLEKGVAAAALAERWAGAAVGVTDFAFLYLGTGIGAGLVTGDAPVRGMTGNAGDIGHLVVDCDGPPCACGMRGCLGVCCRPVGLTREAVEAGVLPPDPRDDSVRAMGRLSRLCRIAEAGDEPARSVLQRAGTRMGRAVVTIADMLDTELVVCGGPAWELVAPLCLPIIQAEVTRQFVMRDIHDVRVTGSSLGPDVAAIGAACLVLDNALAA
jgi:predicted NBD/HSP70 family sugar kinase